MGTPPNKNIAGGFQFITSINTINRDEETRRKVRSHARRQKLGNEASDSSPSGNPSKPNSQKDRTSKFRLAGAPASSGATRRQRVSVPAEVTTTKSKSLSPVSSNGSNGSPSVEVKAERLESWETELITTELGFTIARELPNFATLPIQTTPLTDNLFKYIICVCLSPQEKFVQKWFDRCGAPTYFNTYHSSFLANSHAMNPQGNWFDFITVDPAMTHSFMGLIAAMHNALAEWEDMTTINFHRYEAVKHINGRLGNEGKNAMFPVSDGVIVSVSLLVTIESFIGSTASAKAHMDGLKMMINMRGGLINGFFYSTLLQRALAWADFAYATSAGEPLAFPLVPQLAASLALRDRFTTRTAMINAQSAIRSPADLKVSDSEALELFELLFSITESINEFNFARLEDLQEERGLMSDCIYLTEWRLCKLEESLGAKRAKLGASLSPSFSPFPGEEQGSTLTLYDDVTDISEALVYAGHLFLHVAVRGLPPGARRHRVMIAALMTAVSGTVVSLNLLADSTDLSSDILVSPIDSVSNSSARSSMDSWSTTISEHSNSPSVTEQQAKAPVQPKDDLNDDILLWILFIGACIRVPPPSADDLSLGMEAMLFGSYRSYFLAVMRNYCKARFIYEKEVLILRLKGVIWLDGWCDKQLDLMWPHLM